MYMYLLFVVKVQHLRNNSCIISTHCTFHRIILIPVLFKDRHTSLLMLQSFANRKTHIDSSVIHTTISPIVLDVGKCLSVLMLVIGAVHTTLCNASKLTRKETITRAANPVGYKLSQYHSYLSHRNCWREWS